MIRVLAFLEATYVSGPAKNILEFARCAARFEESARVQTDIAAFQTSLGDDELTDAVSRAGLPLHRIEQSSLPSRSTVQRVRGAIAESQPDIVQTHSIKSHFLLRASGAWKHYPWVAFHHGYTSTVPRLRIYNEFDRWSLRRASRVVTVSRAFAGQLTRKGVPGNRITVLHNAIDPEWGKRAANADLRDATRARLGVAAGEQVALMVGRLSKEKRQVLLIQALDRMKKLSPGLRIRVVIVGEGPERASIVRTAAALGLSNNVILAGHQIDVAPYYAAADLAVISSDSEGSPNALLEAMAAGKPVVATAVGGIPEIVTHDDTALLVPPGDPGKLAEAVTRTISCPEATRDMAARAHALILSHYSPQQRARFLARFYADMLSGSRQ